MQIGADGSCSTRMSIAPWSEIMLINYNEMGAWWGTRPLPAAVAAGMVVRNFANSG